MTPRLNSNLLHDINILKNNVACLQSEVHVLKVDATEIKANVVSLSSELKSDMVTMRQELNACKQIAENVKSTVAIFCLRVFA